MEMSRRGFFRGIAKAAAAAAIASAIPGVLEDPRVKAWRLLDETETAFKLGDQSLFEKRGEEFFAHVKDNFKPTGDFQIQKIDAAHVIKTNERYAADWRTCSASTFAIMLTRDALKYRKLPLVRSRMWKPFATQYSPIVMAA